MGWLRQYLLLVLAVLAAIGLSFVGGVSMGVLGKPPAALVRDTIDAMKDLNYNWRAYFADTPTQHLQPRTFEGDGVVLADTARMQPGPTLLTGLFGNVLGFRLVAEDGTVLHDWPINFFKVAPEEMTHQFHALIHGTVVYPNGDIVANRDGRGMIRFDKCGREIWRNNAKTHHAIFRDSEGYLWAPAAGIERTDERFIALPARFDRVVKVDPDTGEVLETLDLFNILLRSDLISTVSHEREILDDVTHLNDVEVLGPDMAAAFPQFQAGDILLSTRNLHTLWVVDRDTHKVKWRFSGPIRGQHDPDFQPNGTITVLDNRGRETSAETITSPETAKGSRIVRIDPKTDTMSVVYQSDSRNLFRTPFRGKHQMLANGNVLIAETDRGRVFEATPDGDVVWSYINGYDADRVAWVMRADRLDPAFANIDWASCD